MDPISSNVPLSIANRRFARLHPGQAEPTRATLGFGYGSALIGISFLAFGYFLATLAKSAAEQGDAAKVNLLVKYFLGVPLILCFGLAFVMVWQQTKTLNSIGDIEPALESGTARVFLCAAVPGFQGNCSGGILSARDGLLLFEGDRFNFAIDSNSVRRFSQSMGRLEISVKHPIPIKSQFLNITIKVLPAGMGKKAYCTELKSKLFVAQPSQGIPIYPPLEVEDFPVDRQAIVRTAVGGFIGGGLITLFVQHLPKFESSANMPGWLYPFMGLLVGSTCALLAASDALIARSSKKTLAKWLAQEQVKGKVRFPSD